MPTPEIPRKCAGGQPCGSAAADPLPVTPRCGRRSANLTKRVAVVWPPWSIWGSGWGPSAALKFPTLKIRALRLNGISKGVRVGGRALCGPGVLSKPPFSRLRWRRLRPYAKAKRSLYHREPAVAAGSSLSLKTSAVTANGARGAIAACPAHEGAFRLRPCVRPTASADPLTGLSVPSASHERRAERLDKRDASI